MSRIKDAQSRVAAASRIMDIIGRRPPRPGLLAGGFLKITFPKQQNVCMHVLLNEITFERSDR